MTALGLPSTSVPTREFGLHPGFPGHEVARLDTSTRQWVKLDQRDDPEATEDYAFKSLQKAPWFRSVMVPAPGLPFLGARRGRDTVRLASLEPIHESSSMLP